MDSTSTSVRPAYGRRSTVTAVQALVPDEPIEAALIVARQWSFAFTMLAILIALRIATAKRFEDVHGAILISVTAAAALALVVCVAALRDRGSALRLGFQNAAIAVTPTRVLVVAGSAVTGRPRRIVLELDRATAPVMQVETGFGLRSVGVSTPSGQVVVLRVMRGREVDTRIALPMVVSPPPASWEPDPDRPFFVRLRTRDGWVSTTETQSGLALARVDVDVAPQSRRQP